jgi:hypothetical protein
MFPGVTGRKNLVCQTKIQTNRNGDLGSFRDKSGVRIEGGGLKVPPAVFRGAVGGFLFLGPERVGKSSGRDKTGTRSGRQGRRKKGTVRSE